MRGRPGYRVGLALLSATPCDGEVTQRRVYNAKFEPILAIFVSFALSKRIEGRYHFVFEHSALIRRHYSSQIRSTT
jgi:hypothetical protein